MIATPLRTNARLLRSRPTDAERRLWYLLRGKRTAVLRFRRQHPIGPYIVDFVCIERSLIVEVDGGQHQGSVADQRRDAWLTAQGYLVLRFWNNDVLGNTRGVLELIAEAAGRRRPSPPAPLPHAGEGRNGAVRQE